MRVGKIKNKLTMKKLLFYLILVLGLNSYAQITLIPDPNFEQALIDLNYDSGPINGSVPTVNISGIVNLNVGVKNISNLTGIQDFTSLENLDCYSNQLTVLNISGLLNLKYLNCSLNQLTALNISGLNNLVRIICNFNSITSLNASNFPNLNEIQCQGNQLTNISVTGSNQLANLMIGSNQLTSLNVSGLINLHTLHCGSNLLTNLNVTSLTNLLDLRFEFNQLTTINLNGLINLNTLDCRGNQLSCIDLTNKPSLLYLTCFQSTTLTCIQVDNIATAQSNLNWYKDTIASYSLNCSPCTSSPCQTLYVDTDNDGYDNGTIIDCSGTTPTGYSLTTLGTDCDDNNALVTTSSIVIPTNLQTGLLAQYTFNSGSTNDFSGNARHLTNVNSATSVADRNGNLNCAFQFDNIPSSNNQYLTSTSTAFLNGLAEYSISCWYKAEDPSRGIVDYEVLVGRDTGPLTCPDRKGQWSLALYDCRFALFARENSAWESFSNPCNEVEVWHHLTATYNQVGNTIKLYKNGVLQSTKAGVANCGTLVVSPAIDFGDLFLGKDFTGVLDDVFIHNREITAAEVTQLFTLGSSCCASASPCTSLITPTFTPIAPICSTTTVSPLPTVSTNGITGVWSPAFNNMATTTYTFTPDAGQCAITTTLIVTITPAITWYQDADSDGAGNPAVSIVACVQPTGYVNNDNDCDDTNAAINPCSNENITDGIDNNCNGFIDEIVTKLVASDCNITLLAMNELIVCSPIPGNCGYLFKVTKWVGGVISTNPADIQISGIRTNNTFALTMLPQYAYNTTYTVQVSVCVGGVWQPYGAECCTITTPSVIPSIRPADCGITVSSMNQFVYPNAVGWIASPPNNWRFEVINNTTLTTETVYKNLGHFKFSDLILYPATFNTTYSIKVSFKNADGTWQNYGPACNVSTPTVMPTQIVAAQCGFTATSGTQIISATTVTSGLGVVSNYEFRLSNASQPYSQTKVNSSATFFLNQFTGLLTNTTYDVAVRVKIGGYWSTYGPVCTITTPGVFRFSETKEELVSIENTFAAVGYPNPYNNYFNLKLTTASLEPISIKIYDLLGKVVEEHTIDVNELDSYSFGINYPTGVYNAILRQGEQITSVRLIKK